MRGRLLLRLLLVEEKLLRLSLVLGLLHDQLLLLLLPLRQLLL